MDGRQKMGGDMEKKFRYLFERLNEPLGMGVKGSGSEMVYYQMSPQMVSQSQFPSGADETLKAMGAMKSFAVKQPSQMPMKELRMIGSQCPKSGLFGYFIPEHRQALVEMRKILMSQKSVDNLFDMACACRDSPMVHPHLFVNALSSTLAARKDCRGFQMPAFHEIMPDLFISDHAIKQAEKMARVKDADKSIIMLNANSTGDHRDPESKMWYFREDVGVNSHHFHWHVVFPGEWTVNMEKGRNRRGELFYYMHHSMIARYDAERLCNGLARTKLFNFDEPFLEEGYFGKLYSTNAGMHWGTRQENTRLRDLARYDAVNETLWDVRLEDLKKWRDRILEAIDSGYIYRKKDDGDVREKLDEKTGIDILGDIIENSSENTPHAQYYGPFGFHNMGHNVISFSHDPIGAHRETFGPMGDTSTAMRDPMFYRWHKYIDHMFIQYKNTLSPYDLTTGMWPLVWSGVTVRNIEIAKRDKTQAKNAISTHWAQRDINLARGLDFWRNSREHMAPVWARVTFLDYSLFDYRIQVTNSSRSDLRATVRIFIAPVQDEHGANFRLEEQRNMFYEMEKFVHILKPGNNLITRKSEDSSVTVKQENLFHQIENLDKDPGRNDINLGTLKNVDPACGCGWPQNLLVTRGTPSGMPFDMFVIITDGREDESKERPPSTCRDAMSFCGIMDEDYPDKRPMGYPFDRRPYSLPNSSTSVATIEEYVKNIPNASNTRIVITHDNSPPKLKEAGPDTEMPMVDETGKVVPGSMENRPAKGQGTSRPPQGMTKPNQSSKGGKWAPVPPRVPNYNQPWGGPRPAGRSGRDSSWEHLDDEDFMEY